VPGAAGLAFKVQRLACSVQASGFRLQGWGLGVGGWGLGIGGRGLGVGGWGLVSTPDLYQGSPGNGRETLVHTTPGRTRWTHHARPLVHTTPGRTVWPGVETTPGRTAPTVLLVAFGKCMSNICKYLYNYKYLEMAPGFCPKRLHSRPKVDDLIRTSIQVEYDFGDLRSYFGVS
jgi:hypothetical protein